jgi:large subunit ribosomal protein L17e
MLLTKAEEYLKDVLEHKRCIPYSRYDHSVGRCSAAIQFGLTKGRYPEKSVRIMLNLLKNAKANGEVKGLNADKILIKNVLVNHATEGRRRTYRAHGSINAYCSSNCHVDIICEEVKDNVKKEKKKKKKSKIILLILSDISEELLLNISKLKNMSLLVEKNKCLNK